MKVMYELTHYYWCEIKAVQVERETEKSVWVVGQRGVDRRDRKASFGGFYETWEAARDAALEYCSGVVLSAQRRLDDAKGHMGNVKGWEKPKEADNG